MTTCWPTGWGTHRPVWSPPGPRTTFPKAPPGVHDFPHPPRLLPACTACASVVSPVLPVAPKIAIFLTVMLRDPGPEKLRTPKTRGNTVAARRRAAGPLRHRRRGRDQKRLQPPRPRPPNLGSKGGTETTTPPPGKSLSRRRRSQIAFPDPLLR